jgi:hypothetical protein
MILKIHYFLHFVKVKKYFMAYLHVRFCSPILLSGAICTGIILLKLFSIAISKDCSIFNEIAK